MDHTRRTLDYITTPPFAEPVQVAEPDADWSTLLQCGDVIFCRSTGVLGNIIERADGFWTHCAIVIDPAEGLVAHAQGAGLNQMTFDDLKQEYPGGLAAARPAYGERSGADAATWAEQNSAKPKPAAGQVASPVIASPVIEGVEIRDYGMRELALAFVVLTRSAMTWRRQKEPISPDQMTELLDAADAVVAERREGDIDDDLSTCSGFVWRSYLEGAGKRILPSIKEGVIVKNGELRAAVDFADDAAELAALATWADGLDASTDGDVPQARQLYARSTKDDDSSGATPSWSSQVMGLLKLVPRLFPGLALLAQPWKGVALNDGITPGDLWCSPSLRGRIFLNVAAAEAATGT